MTRTIRPRTMTITGPVGAVGLVVLMAYGAVHVAGDHAYDGRPLDRIGVAGLLILLGAVGGWLLLSLGRTGFVARDDEVVVRNIVRTYTFPRAEIHGLRASRGGDWARLELTSGATVVVMALSVGARWTLGRRLQVSIPRLGGHLE